ncbi:hypothetical protein LC653_25955 [Nostoc sp. CHAB 5784]|uniref:hypothetical protein n=1 Tax=Nostoc mirabile TaxID=2907820 RepID=UPI001E63AB69|nr:hypothetical protein [Nostoc mirabile]MCC5667237.1 hypothetical protein [Nostoc mirabile CHAB5784]
MPEQIRLSGYTLPSGERKRAFGLVKLEDYFLRTKMSNKIAKVLTQLLLLEALFLLLLTVFPAYAQNRADEIKRKCRSSINKSKSRLEKGRKLKVVAVNVRNVADSHSVYPKESPLELVFGMEGAAVESVISNSPQFLSSLTKDLITQCPVVSLMTFGQYRTDFFISIGRIGNNLAIFECHPRSGELGLGKLPWGYQTCF